MFQPQELKKNLAIFAAISGSLLIGIPAIAQNTTQMNSPASTGDSVIQNQNPEDLNTPNSSDRTAPTQSEVEINSPSMNNDRLTPITPTRVSPTNRNRQSFNQTNGVSPLNPCPSIFYEAPFNELNVLPQGCPANSPNSSSTRQQIQSRNSKLTPTSSIRLMDGRMVNVKLRNNTGVAINYEVIGDTNQRRLSGRSNTMLENLQAPVNITFRRTDGGLLRVTPMTSQSGMLEVVLTETSNLSVDKKAVNHPPLIAKSNIVGA